MLEAKLPVVKVVENSSVVGGITGNGGNGSGKMAPLSEPLHGLGGRAPGDDAR